MKIRLPRGAATAAGVLLITISLRATAHEIVAGNDLERYREDGSLAERQDRIATLKQSRIPESCRQRTLYRIQRAQLEASGMTPSEAARALTSGPSPAFPFTAKPELRSHGTVRTLTILIDFQDMRASTVLPGLTPTVFQQNIYGTGTPAAQAFKPHESVHEYYRRASQGKVDLQGDVLGWYAFPKKRSEYEPARAPLGLPPRQRQEVQARNDNAALFSMLKEALTAYDATHDFSQYDNDNDGDLDLVTILYSGPDTGWGSFWWAYRWEFFTDAAATTFFDGKRAKQFVFQFIDKRGPDSADFKPTTLLHEMGHAFGLADYYDYDPNIGPQGGVGGLDMMHANIGNQNCFSRWLLDWDAPIVIGSGAPAQHTLPSSGSDQTGRKSIAIFPGLTGTLAPESELFLIENRNQVGNDTGTPGSGLLIWHVDASVNNLNTDFANDNSYTDRKLIRLVRADNPNDFLDHEHAGATTYFRNGTSFSPTTTPSSADYSGSDTRVVIDQISPPGDLVTLRVGFLPSPHLGGGPSPAPTPAPAPPPPPAPPELPGAGAETPAVSMESVLAGTSALTLDTLEDLDEQLSDAKPEALAGFWQRIASKPVAERSDTEVVVAKLLVSQWASKDGQASSEAVLKLAASDPIKNEVMPIALESWASSSPAKAAEWYLSPDRTNLRDMSQPELSRFTRSAFEGLYAVNATHAIKSLDKLGETGELIGAINGIVIASATKGEDADTLDHKLYELTSDVAKAQFDFLKAARIAEKSIKDPKQRNEFLKYNQYVLPE
jgi:M6 family metalloprotease-like protein